MRHKFAFADSYSAPLARALRGASPEQCREIAKLALARVPKYLIGSLPSEVREAFDAFQDDRVPQRGLTEKMWAHENRYMVMSDEADDRGDEALAKEYYGIRSVCGALAPLVSGPVLLPKHVDQCLYQLVDIMDGDYKRDLEGFVAQSGGRAGRHGLMAINQLVQKLAGFFGQP